MVGFTHQRAAVDQIDGNVAVLMTLAMMSDCFLSTKPIKGNKPDLKPSEEEKINEDSTGKF